MPIPLYADTGSAPSAAINSEKQKLPPKKPKLRRKRIHWRKIPKEREENSVWNDLQNAAQDVQLGEEFEKLFIASAAEPKEEKKSKKKVQS